MTAEPLEDAVAPSPDPVPVAAVVLLRIGAEGEVRLERANPMVALRDLWVLAFRIPESDDRARAFEQLGDLVRAVPVYDLTRPLTFDTLPDVVDRVVQLCES